MHRVGVIPFDIRGSAMALLFVTSQTRGRWILPKGAIKSGESHVEACKREAFEEAGINGIVLEDFPITVMINKQSDTEKQAVPVTYYPMLVGDQADEWPESNSRERHWALLTDAQKVVYREDYLGLIKQFSKISSEVTEVAKAHRS